MTWEQKIISRLLRVWDSWFKTKFHPSQNEVVTRSLYQPCRVFKVGVEQR